MSALIAGDRAGSWLRCRFGSHAVSLRIGAGWPDCSSWAPSRSGLCSTGLRFALFSRGEVRCVLDRLAGQESPVLRQRCVRPLRWLATDLVAVHAPWRVRSIAVSGSCSPFQANRALACRSGSASPLSHPRSSRRRSARQLVQGFEPVGPRPRLFLVSSRDGTSRLQRRCSAFFEVPSVLARASERRLVASVHGLRRGRAVRRSRARSSVRSLHAVACQSGWRTVVGRSAAISVRRGDRGLSFANSGSPGFAAGYGCRLIALDLVFNAPGRLRRRRGATRFRERDGLRGGGSVGRFVWDLSVPGRASRKNRAVEMAPAVRDSAGGTFGAGSICEGAREGWGRVLDVRFAENQYRDRP